MPAELLRLGLLQLLFASHRLIALPDSSSLFFAIPMAEVLWFGAILSLGSRLAGRRKSRSLLALGLAPATALLLVHNGGEAFYRYFYLQHFTLRTDLALIPGLARMLLPGLPMSDAVLGIFSVSLVALLLLSLAWLLMGALLALGARRRKPYSRQRWLSWLPASALFLMGTVLFIVLPDQSPLANQMRTVLIPAQKSQASSTLLTPAVDADPPSPTWVFPGIQDGDIHIIVVESYGVTLLEQGGYRPGMLELYARLEDELAASKYIVLSGTVDSPAFGGRSWLADATLLTGRTIADQGEYDRIATEGVGAPLLERMGRSGYRRIYAAPGTRNAPDAWRQAYPFEDYLLRYDFEYAGPFINFGAMPDQYLLNYVADHKLSPGAKDFAFYLLVSSHVPFEKIPSYREDWAFPLKGAEFTTEELLVFDNNWLSGKELAQGYLAGIAYSLRSSVGLFSTKLAGTSGEHNIGLIIGDHQPRKPVSHPTADYRVPYHVIIPEALYEDTVLERLGSWKLTKGFMPRLDTDASAMASLLDLLEIIFKGEE